MIDPLWKRIAGIHVLDEGLIGAVWMAHDKQTDIVHLYDACVFKLEVLAVIAEGLNARGRWIPIAWEKGSKEVAEKLLDRGCNTIPEPIADSPALAEMTSRDIWERMRSGRFKVDKRLKVWTDEYTNYYRDESQIPTGAYPLMNATRYAVGSLPFARKQSSSKTKTNNAPKLAII